MHGKQNWSEVSAPVICRTVRRTATEKSSRQSAFGFYVC